MPDIIHRIGNKASPEQIYPLLTTDTGLSTWWTIDTKGAAEAGSIIEFRFGGSGPDFKVIELIPYELVRWQHSGVMPKDWMDTDIVFGLDQDGEQTLVHFTHGNWCEASSFMAHCSMKWAVFLLSLKDVVETGKGKPYPDDVHIDHH